MKVIELLSKLCEFDTVTIVISLVVAVLTAVISNFTKTKKLKLYLPFILGVVICLIYKVFLKDDGFSFELSDVVTGFLCGSISYALTAIYYAFTTSNGVPTTPLGASVTGLLESFGIQNADDLSHKIIDAVLDSGEDFNNTEKIIESVLKDNLPEHSDDDVKILTDAIYNLINTF